MVSGHEAVRGGLIAFFRRVNWISIPFSGATVLRRRSKAAPFARSLRIPKPHSSRSPRNVHVANKGIIRPSSKIHEVVFGFGVSTCFGQLGLSAATPPTNPLLGKPRREILFYSLPNPSLAKAREGLKEKSRSDLRAEAGNNRRNGMSEFSGRRRASFQSQRSPQLRALIR